MTYHYLQASMKGTTIKSGSKTSLSLGEYDIRAISIPKKPSHSCKSQKLQQDPYPYHIVKILSRKLPSQNLENVDNRIYSCLQYIHHQTISTSFHLYNLSLKWPRQITKLQKCNCSYGICHQLMSNSNYMV
jgi:hypothetical protein